MANEQFLKELDDFQQQVVKECEQFGKDITYDILDEITDLNARDTGKCIASWVASVGAPQYGEASDITEFNKISREEAKARSIPTLANLVSYKLGDTIYLSNGTSYVSGIEDGTNSVKSILFVSSTANRYDQAINWKVNVP